MTHDGEGQKANWRCTGINEVLTCQVIEYIADRIDIARPKIERGFYDYLQVRREIIIALNNICDLCPIAASIKFDANSSDI